MKSISAGDVAKFFLKYANETGELITNLKLQKMLYYAQGYHLALNGSILFKDEIQAWAHGPVVPNVYREYKKFKWRPISYAGDWPSLTKKKKEYLTVIFKNFMPIDAFQLEQMTHAESPWLNARVGYQADAVCKNSVSVDDMKEYFSGLISDV